MSEIVDCRGLSCPEPVLQARQAMAASKEGQVTVLVDATVARDNVTRAAKSLGWQVEVTEEGKDYKLLLQK